MDWAGLTHYGSENAELRAPKPGEDRVVFLGDDLTERWGAGIAPFFPGKPYLNRGIARQTSPQMLVRFRQDVIALKPKVVVIQAGSNDLAGYTGPATEGMIARELHVDGGAGEGQRDPRRARVGTPVCDCFINQTARRPQGKIIGLNGWIEGVRRRERSVYLDYYSALADGRNLKKNSDR